MLTCTPFSLFTVLLQFVLFNPTVLPNKMLEPNNLLIRHALCVRFHILSEFSEWLMATLHLQKGCKILRSLSRSVCLWVCPLAYLKNPHCHTSWRFMYIFPMALAQSSPNNNAISHVLLVLWMTSFFHIMEWAKYRYRLLTNYSRWLASWCHGEVCYCWFASLTSLLLIAWP